jgi:hypothetical protein
MRVLIASLLLLLAACSGCTAGLTVATAASAAALAGETLDTGNAVYSMGKLDSAERARLPECLDCIHAASIDLGLDAMTEKTLSDGRMRLAFKDKRHKVTDVWLDPRSPTMTLVRIDVGWFGSQPTARLFLSRFKYHLLQLREEKPLPPGLLE